MRDEFSRIAWLKTRFDLGSELPNGRLVIELENMQDRRSATLIETIKRSGPIKRHFTRLAFPPPSVED